MSGKSILITGATGIMGSWVLGEAIKRGYDPVILMRDGHPSRARERLVAVLRLQDLEGYIDKVKVVYGDTRLPDLGLDVKEVAHLRTTLSGMIHCAASTSFSPRCDAELWATNVGGVANVIHFLAGSGIPLYHISTAFVVGKRRGHAMESELDLNQGFNNTYERSKCESESLVQEAISKGSVKAAIFRPAIIVGSSQDGRISQFMNFYSFLRFLDVVSSRKLGELTRLRIKANPDTTKNIVPVDWTTKALWHIIENDGPSGKTYHLTNPKPVPLSSMKDWTNEYLSSRGLRVEFASRLDSDLNTLERAANASFRLYSAYLQDEPIFDRTNTDNALNGALPFPEVGPMHYLKMLAFAQQQNWKGIFGCKFNIAKVDDDNVSGMNVGSEQAQSEVPVGEPSVVCG